MFDSCGSMVDMGRRQAIEQDHVDAEQLATAAERLRRETNQARYANHHLDPYPLYALSAVLDAAARLIRRGDLPRRSELRAELLRLATQLTRTPPIDPRPGLGSPTG